MYDDVIVRESPMMSEEATNEIGSFNLFCIGDDKYHWILR